MLNELVSVMEVSSNVASVLMKGPLVTSKIPVTSEIVPFVMSISPTEVMLVLV